MSVEGATRIATSPDDDTDRWTDEERNAAEDAYVEAIRGYVARQLWPDLYACEAAARDAVACMRANVPEICP